MQRCMSCVSSAQCKRTARSIHLQVSIPNGVAIAARMWTPCGRPPATRRDPIAGHCSTQAQAPCQMSHSTHFGFALLSLVAIDDGMMRHAWQPIDRVAFCLLNLVPHPSLCDAPYYAQTHPQGAISTGARSHAAPRPRPRTHLKSLCAHRTTPHRERRRTPRLMLTTPPYGAHCPFFV